MSSFNPNSQQTAKFITELFQTHHYNGVAYSNLQLYGNGITEEVDRDCKISPYSVSTYWPGGIPHLEGTSFGTFLLNQSDAKTAYSKISEIRTTILGLDLSKRAVKRWTAIKAGLHPEAGQLESPQEDIYVPIACGISEVPLSTVVLSEVLRHRKIKAGQTIAHMYFPTILKDPRFALAELKDAQRMTVAAEQV